jgi:hypothetical protein
LIDRALVVELVQSFQLGIFYRGAPYGRTL